MCSSSTHKTDRHSVYSDTKPAIGTGTGILMVRGMKKNEKQGGNWFMDQISPAFTTSVSSLSSEVSS